MSKFLPTNCSQVSRIDEYIKIDKFQYVLCLVAQSCLTLCDPMDCSPPGSSVHGDSPGKNTGVGCQALLQGVFPTQGSNPGLLHCRQILYHLNHQGSPIPIQIMANTITVCKLSPEVRADSEIYTA